MRRRVDIRIDAITVDAALATDRRALAAAVEQALRQRLLPAGAAAGLRSRAEGAVDGGHVPSSGGVGAIGSAVADTVLPPGQRR